MGLFSKTIKVLLVDDDDRLRRAGKLILENWNMEVIEGINGKEAISKAKDKKPDIVLLDVGLPSMDGFEVCKVLKNNSSTKKIPILLLTGRGKIGDVDKGYNAGADSYLIKPVDWDRLREKIDEIL